MFLNQLFEGLRDPKDNPCWKGYHPVGTKKKDGRTVPNCVPNANEDVTEGAMKDYAIQQVVDQLLDGELDPYDVMNRPQDAAQEQMAAVLQDMYDDVAHDFRLHPDDDFEQIFDMVMDRLEDDYGHSTNQNVAEVSTGDYYKKATMQRAQAGMGAGFARSPEEREKQMAIYNKRDRGLNRLKNRHETARKAEQEKQLADLVARLPELKAEYAEMQKQYKALGGSNWQYADREQNLTDGERKARAMEGPMNNLWRQIQAAEKATTAPAVAETQDEKIGGRYEPDEFDQMVMRLKQKAKEQDRKNGPVDLEALAKRLHGIEQNGRTTKSS